MVDALFDVAKLAWLLYLAVPFLAAGAQLVLMGPGILLPRNYRKALAPLGVVLLAALALFVDDLGVSQIIGYLVVGAYAVVSLIVWLVMISLANKYAEAKLNQVKESNNVE